MKYYSKSYRSEIMHIYINENEKAGPTTQPPGFYDRKGVTTTDNIKNFIEKRPCPKFVLNNQLKKFEKSFLLPTFQYLDDR